MDLKLAGKNVLVTGAGQGLGREIGLAFAREGANVAFHYNSSAQGAMSCVVQAKALGVNALAVSMDISDEASVLHGVDEVRSNFGSIDVLVNNAGATQRKPFLDTSFEDWKPQIEVTVIGTLRITQLVAKHMVGGGGGSIVNLMGDSGRVGESGLLVTSATRSSTIGLTKSLAKEFARYKVRANAISIGLVQTDNFEAHVGDGGDDRMKKILAQYPLRRLGRADDVTPTVLLLASPLSSWTTGQILSINGGYTMP